MAAFTKEQVVECLKQVYDPEIPVNIYDLGLIYDVDVDSESSEVNVVMTLTSQACPAAGEIPRQVEQKVTGTLGADKCLVHLVWNPPWGPQLISPEGKKILGMPEEDAATTPPAGEASETPPPSETA